MAQQGTRQPPDEEEGGSDDGGSAEPMPSFEASAERLAAIVEQLESGDLSLERALELFEEGVRVARTAQQRLELAEKRVEELLSIDRKGEPRTRPFES